MEITRKKFLIGAASTLLIPAVEVAEASSTIITRLPSSKAKRLAWTIDDGVSSAAVRSYLDIAEKGDHHLTLFVSSMYSSWKTHSRQISRLLAEGKIQLGNHTVNHKDLTTLSEKQIKNQLIGCHNFMMGEYGYDARPYYRPPYALSNAKVRSAAADLGYTVTTMWYGSFGDTFGVPQERVVRFAKKWIADERILIDHCNRLKTQSSLKQIQDIMRARGLKSVTLAEAFGKDFK
jgi:peptidoglycan/xylan/chitin deacetylase (PgdA/CDA1 family)